MRRQPSGVGDPASGGGGLTGMVATRSESATVPERRKDLTAITGTIEAHLSGHQERISVPDSIGFPGGSQQPAIAHLHTIKKGLLERHQSSIQDAVTTRVAAVDPTAAVPQCG